MRKSLLGFFGQLFTIPCENMLLIRRHRYWQWMTANLGTYCFEQGRIIIVLQLLWHRTSVFAVSSKNCSNLVALHHKQGVLRSYSTLDPSTYSNLDPSTYSNLDLSTYSNLPVDPSTTERVIIHSKKLFFLNKNTSLRQIYGTP